jgi:hypothetical protein
VNSVASGDVTLAIERTMAIMPRAGLRYERSQLGEVRHGSIGRDC